MKKLIIRVVALFLVIIFTSVPVTNVSAASLDVPAVDFVRNADGEIELLPLIQMSAFDLTNKNDIRTFHWATLTYLVKVRIDGQEFYSYAAMGHFHLKENPSPGIFTGDVYLAEVTGFSFNDSGDSFYECRIPQKHKTVGTNLYASLYGLFGLYYSDQIPSLSWMGVREPVDGEKSEFWLPTIGISQYTKRPITIEIPSVRGRINNQKIPTTSIDYYSKYARLKGASGSLIVSGSSEIIGVHAASSYDRVDRGAACDMTDILQSHLKSLQKALSTQRGRKVLKEFLKEEKSV